MAQRDFKNSVLRPLNVTSVRTNGNFFQGHSLKGDLRETQIGRLFVSLSKIEVIMNKSKLMMALGLSLSLATLTAHAEIITAPVKAVPSIMLAPQAMPANSLATSSDYLSVLESLDVDSIREALLKTWSHGVNPAAYWTAEMETSFTAGMANQPEIRSQILASYLKALKDISTGTLISSTVAEDIKVKKKDFVTADQLRSILANSSGHADLLLEHLAPQSSAYLSLRTAMGRLYPVFLKGGWERIAPVKQTLSLGMRNSVIKKLKARLQILGYKISSNDSVFDQEFLQAINDVQANLKIKPDGKMSATGKTWTYFNVSSGDRVRQIQADMEKLRWFPQYFEDRHIFVNTAFSQFTLTDKTQNIAMNFRTVNGAVKRKTPTMRDKITYLVLNPTWTMPSTVLLEDKVPVFRTLGSQGIEDYFAKNNLQMFTSDFSKTIDPATINWAGVNATNVNFYIRQKPNYMNALGVVKFMMTNPYSVYLHDTEHRDLFVEAQRLLSSGCVRLEKPLDLAEYLLAGTSWTRANIENFVAKPGQVLDNETRVNLKDPMPVYLIPVTSQMSSDGVIRFVEDAYGHNKVILTQLKGIGR